MGISERKEREKLRRRNEIIDAAERVFFSKGEENATMDEVAHEAELSKGTLYLYFRNKEELQYAIKMRATIKLKEFFSGAVQKSATGYENVESIGRAFISYSQEYPEYFNTMMFFEGKELGQLNFDDPYIRKFMEEQSPMYLFVDEVKRGQGDGSVRDDIPAHVIAHNLWAMTTGVLQLVTHQERVINMHGYEADHELFIESMFKMFQNGILK